MCEKKTPTVEDTPNVDNSAMEDVLEVESDDGAQSSYEDEDEYIFLDNQLNALNSALDDIEKKNNDLQRELLELLENNKIIRRELQDLKECYTVSFPNCQAKPN